MVPSPNPENKVNALVKKEAMITMRNSNRIVLSWFKWLLLIISGTGSRTTGRLKFKWWLNIFLPVGNKKSQLKIFKENRRDYLLQRKGPHCHPAGIFLHVMGTSPPSSCKDLPTW